jgi:hypothetical protein
LEDTSTKYFHPERILTLCQEQLHRFVNNLVDQELISNYPRKSILKNSNNILETIENLSELLNYFKVNDLTNLETVKYLIIEILG